MKEMLSEEQIIEGCLKNDRRVQKALYDKYSPKMYAICLRYAKDKAEAQDVLQDGFMRVFMNVKQFSEGNSFEGWMRRIFVNTAISNYKSNLKHYYHQDIEEHGDSSSISYKINDSEFTQEELMDAVKNLSDGYRMVFNLYAIEGFKHKEIGEMLGIDVATSKSQYHRAKKILQVQLQEMQKEKL